MPPAVQQARAVHFRCLANSVTEYLEEGYSPFPFSKILVRQGWAEGVGGHSEAIATTQSDAVHNLIGMTALVMWPKLPNFVKLVDKVTF